MAIPEIGVEITQVPHLHRYRWMLSFLLVVALCYGLVLSLLSAWDDSPRWARVEHPPMAQVNTPLVVKVHYRGLETSALLDVGLRLRDDQRHNLGMLSPQERAPVVSGSGTRVFAFAVAGGTSASTVQVTVQRREVPVDPNIPVTQCRPIDRALPTEEIALLSDSESLCAWHEARSLRRILIRAYQEGHWKDKAGDPTVLGWLVTALYLGTAGLCLSNVRGRRKNTHTASYQWFWWFLGLTLLFLGINKQLDFQMLLADVGRTYARTLGWYRTRKPVQIRAVALAASLSLGFLGVVLYQLRRAPRSTWCALGGLLLLVGLVSAHLVSLHRLEHILRRPLLGLPLGTLLEIGATMVVAVSAWLYRFRRQQALSSSN